jgi:methyl-accepting chemotaxis protein
MKKLAPYQLRVFLLLFLLILVSIANYFFVSQTNQSLVAVLFMLASCLLIIALLSVSFRIFPWYFSLQDVEKTKIDKSVLDSKEKELEEVKGQLQKLNNDIEERRWYSKGRNEIGDLLREAQRAGNQQDLFDKFLRKLINYLEANQGGLFLINDTGEKPTVELVASYAYSKKKYQEKKFGLHEGLIGQCIKENATLYLEEVPEGYVHITSGLGEALPKALLIVPIKTNEKVLGAVEVASFQVFTPNEIQLAETLAERLGGAWATIQSAEQTKKLLEASNRINRKLMQKEEQMRASTEELSKTKEILSQKLLELEQETNLSANILEAINKTNAAVEFDFEGNILNVNDMYLRVMGYKRDELIGANEKMLLATDEIGSQRYHLLWDSLRNGSYITGEYRRVSKTGKEVWLNGTYNPIFDLGGKPQKVIQFAQFTTEEKERDLDYASRINALNASLPVLELDNYGVIKTANTLMSALSGYKRTQLINKQIRDFIQPIPEFENIWKNIEIGEVQSMLMVFISKEENLIYFFATLSPIKNLSGKIYKIQVLLVNLTNQKEMEIELLNKQEAMRNMVQALEVAKIELQNRERELERLLAQERAKNVILSGQDAEEEKLFAEKLEEILNFVQKQKTKKFDILVHKSAMPVIAINKSGEILLANQQVEDLVKYSSLEIKALKINDLLNATEGKETQHQKILEKILKGDVVKQRMLIKDKIGSYLPARLISMPTFSENADILIFLNTY